MGQGGGKEAVDYVVIEGDSGTDEFAVPWSYGSTGDGGSGLKLVEAGTGGAGGGGRASGNGDDDESVSNASIPPQHKKLVYVCALASSLTSVLLGYDVGVMSGAILYIGEDLEMTTLQKEMVVGSLNLIAAFGGLIAGKFSDALGRKAAIALACVIFVCGATMATLAQGFGVMLAVSARAAVLII
eukprot:TRINITY_DN2967_c0_g1_i2.p1 TRINITY_DN2967_c0_g1~~TRINITY_DN2967_c0_g1_i2.p1  ORF type:complete len:185 (+),score=65.62 TRINITY_DN2967_c0_g1_i2:219-773(+)